MKVLVTGHRGYRACFEAPCEREQLTKLVESDNPPWLN